MVVIDEKGRLFGLVNVIDAVVVLLALAIAAAGVGLILGGQESPEENTSYPDRYATLSYTVPLGSEGAALAPGDTFTKVRGGEAYNVTDVYRTFTPNGSVYVVSRVAYKGKFPANSTQLYGGQSIPVTTGSYRVDADILSVNRTNAALATKTVPVVLYANVSTSVAERIGAGQQATIGGNTVGTVESVHRSEKAGYRQRIWVGVHLEVWERNGVTMFDGKSLRIDNQVTLITDAIILRGHLHKIGTVETAPAVEG